MVKADASLLLGVPLSPRQSKPILIVSLGLMLCLPIRIGVAQEPITSAPQPASVPRNDLVVWGSDISRGVLDARKNGKPVLVFGSAVWCAESLQLMKGPFRTPIMRLVFHRFQLVSLDMDAKENEAVWEQFSIRGLPWLAILDSDGVLVAEVSIASMPKGPGFDEALANTLLGHLLALSGGKGDLTVVGGEDADPFAPSAVDNNQPPDGASPPSSGSSALAPPSKRVTERELTRSKERLSFPDNAGRLGSAPIAGLQAVPGKELRARSKSTWVKFDFRSNTGTGLDEQVLRKYVGKQLAKVRWCIQKETQRQAQAIDGTIDADFIISGTGKVSDASIGENGAGGPPLAKCVAEKLRTWRFPSPRDQTSMRVSVRFHINPEAMK
jgi:hypothetical protein